jgi:hypothetical protein
VDEEIDEEDSLFLRLLTLRVVINGEIQQVSLADGPHFLQSSEERTLFEEGFFE